jgi:hypothetical protein
MGQHNEYEEIGKSAVHQVATNNSKLEMNKMN